MNIIIPMAGMGKRMRPHTLTVPKPLIPVAGKPIVERLAESIVEISKQDIEEIAFIIGDFGKEVEDELICIAEKLGAVGKIYYQHEALGTAHAILCAAPSLKGNVTVAFADTLFFADFEYKDDCDGIIWTHQVEDPSAFGVVTTDDKKRINGFVEKPKDFVSDQAIIGIYYFKDGDMLRSELQYLIDHNIVRGVEYQLTDALQNMLDKGMVFKSESIDEWLDCGNKDATVYTNKRILERLKPQKEIPATVCLENSMLIQPCYIGENAKISNSIIGPHVSIGNNSKIEHSIVSESIIQSHTSLKNVNINASMLGNYVEVEGKQEELNIGDFTSIK